MEQHSAIAVDTLISSAKLQFKKGHRDDVVRLTREVLAHHPDHMEAMLLLGVVSAERKDVDTALPLLTKVVEQDPSSFNGFFWSAMMLRGIGSKQQALEAAQKAVDLSPIQPNALNLLGLCHLDLDQWQSAVECFRRAVKQSPLVATMQLNLGVALAEMGHRPEAAQAMRLAIELDPNQSQAMYRLGKFMLSDLDYPRAAEYGERILTIDPNSAPAHLLLAAALAGNNKPGEAMPHVSRALELEPDRPESLTLASEILQMLGKTKEAHQTLRKSLSLDPLQGRAYYALVADHESREEDRELIAQMDSILNAPSLPRVHRADLHFALGKVADDIGDYGKAMAHFDVANRLVRERRFGLKPFEPKLYEESIEFVTTNLGKDFVEAGVKHGLPNELPVFVVGMMRSGTTLVEQILSSHPGIGGAGEQRFWMDHRNDVFEWPSVKLNADQLKGLAARYLAVLNQIAPGRARVVDKLPSNYANLGVLHVAFPNARIIHVRRHPVDTCLSIWSTPNSTPLEWANEKAGVVLVYKQYRRLMEHWRSSLPHAKIFEVDYEQLVSEPERTSRELIDFCGLEWSDACLNPELNPRPVVTPSAWQVRKPIYRSATDRWRRYGRWLGEFAELLPLDCSANKRIELL